MALGLLEIVSYPRIVEENDDHVGLSEGDDAYSVVALGHLEHR
jgi:hypothetical protein